MASGGVCVRLQGCRRDPRGRVTPMTENTRHSFGRNRIDGVEQNLERWLLLQARAGIPELVLLGLLREYADVIERHGVIPRSWDRRRTRVSTRHGDRPVDERSSASPASLSEPGRINDSL